MKRFASMLLALAITGSAMAANAGFSSDSPLQTLEPSRSMTGSAEILKADASLTEEVVAGLSSFASYLHSQGEDELGKKITYFINFNRDKFTPAQLQRLKEILSGLDAETLNYLNMTDFKDPTVSLILSVITGTLGVDRFYIGDIGLGVGKLLTCGGLGVWWIIDIFMIQNATKDRNFESVQEMLAIMN